MRSGSIYLEQRDPTLEKQFHVFIFDRSRHPVVPTLKGADLIQQAKFLLGQQKPSIATAVRKNNEPVGDFKLGILSGLAPYLLPLFTRRIAQRYPGLNLSLVEAKPSEIITAEKILLMHLLRSPLSLKVIIRRSSGIFRQISE